MPIYEYECTKCEQKFTIKLTFDQHDKHEQVKCPHCRSTDVHQLVSSVHLKTDKKS
jgi:putative FmdB family regulatory protein